MSICEVCGSNGAHYHYNGLVCQSCRVFFIRTVVQQKVHICLESKEKCIISIDHRPFCAACRFQKCLAVNMQAKEVGNTRKQRCVVTLFTKNQTIDILTAVSESFPTRFQLIKSLESVQSATEFANRLVTFEKHCINLDGPSPSSSKCNINISLEDLIRDPELCSSRSTAAWDVLEEFALSNNIKHEYKFANAYCRILTLFADFISAVPEVQDLTATDKLKLFQQNISSFSIFCIAYCKIKSTIGRKQFVQWIEKYNVSTEDKTFLSNAFAYVVSCAEPIFNVIKEIDMKETELVILKMITLFSGVVGLSSEGNKHVYKARGKYSVLLGEYIRENHQKVPNKEKIYRLQKLLSVVQLIKNISEVVGHIYTELAAKNIGNIRGQLSYDLHLRQL